MKQEEILKEILMVLKEIEKLLKEEHKRNCPVIYYVEDKEWGEICKH